MMLLFSPCKRCRCPCSDAVLRSCEEALAGIILRPPSLWFAWVRSGCWLKAGAARRPGGRRPGGGIPWVGGGGGGGGPGPETIHTCMHTQTQTTMLRTYSLKKYSSFFLSKPESTKPVRTMFPSLPEEERDCSGPHPKINLLVSRHRSCFLCSC